MKDDELRARFEVWVQTTSGWKACKQRGKPMHLRQNADGSYNDFRVNDRWFAWQACHAAMQGEDVRRDGATQNWIELNTKAQSKVESSVLWERFIDGTPLSNDIACWMADFAIEAIDTAMGERHELS